MEIRFLGTGTSTGVPQIGCNCATCTSTDARDKRLRASAIVTLDSGKNILIDVKGDRTVNVFAANENELKTIVYTADGRTINEYSVKGDTIDINLPAAGLYIVKVIGEKSTAMKKVVVE